MDEGFRLETFDFVEPAEIDPRKIAIPTELPPMQGRGQISPELQKSAAIEALIAQNEDLMARLKVNLRRLTQCENEVDELRRENRKLSDINDAMKDQTAVFSEKEITWSEKLKNFERQIEILQEKAQNSFVLAEKVERYKKYQERIKTQVKPFVQQLKGYADNLNAEVQKLYAEVGEKDHEIDQLKAQKARLDDQMQEISHRHEQHQAAIIDQFEKDREILANQLIDLKAKCNHLEAEAKIIDQMRTREDELENLVVALKRDKELQYKDFQDSDQRLKAEVGQLRSQNKFQEAKIEELEKKVKVHDEEKDRLAHQNNQLQEQIGSLRFMWSSQSQDLEKTKSALAALEKLNVELSRKLNSSRTTSQASERSPMGPLTSPARPAEL